VKSSTPYPISLSIQKLKKYWMCVNRWTLMFLKWVYAFWHPMQLKRLRANRQQLESTTWTWSSTYVINSFYYIFCLLYDIFILIQSLNFSKRLSTFTRGGAYKVIPYTIELSKTLGPWPGYW
jgi:hypothetical protein